MKKKSFMWTKKNIQNVINLWDTKTKEQIADEIGCEVTSIDYITHLIRKEGFPLTKKWRGGYIRSLVKEAISEIKK